MDSKNKMYSMTTSSAAIYTCPTGKTATIVAINIANTGTANITATFTIYDSSTSTSYTLGNLIAVPAYTSITPVGLPIILEENDRIDGLASMANCHVVLSVLEK